MRKITQVSKELKEKIIAKSILLKRIWENCTQKNKAATKENHKVQKNILLVLKTGNARAMLLSKAVAIALRKKKFSM
jgi:hypothetical protein